MLECPLGLDATGGIDQEFLDLTDSEDLTTEEVYTTDEDTEDTIDLTYYYDDEIQEEEEELSSISENEIPSTKRTNPRRVSYENNYE